MDPGLTIVLLGHSGVGKSATGNTILGRPVFESRKALIPVTRQIDEQTGSVFGKKVSVIDTPGILCAGAEEQVRTRCQEVLQSSRPRLFLVLIRVGRFTAQKAVEAAVRALGDEGLKHSYLLFTGGDGLKIPLEDYIFEFKASPLVQFAERFGQRFLLFNNKTNEEEQVRQLLEKSQEVQKVPEINLPGLTIVLLGHSGVGKSATGNTILGRTAFESKLSVKPVTTQICEQTGSVLGTQVSVVDTPGIFCDGAEREIKTFCREALESSRPKLFLVLLRVGRFTAEDQKAVEAAVSLLSDRQFETCYLLFTGGDALKDITLDHYINEDHEGPLQNLVCRFSGRNHVFNNEDGGQEQVRQLLLKSADGLRKSLLLSADGLRKSLQLVERRIILFGVSGSGISSSGNTILGPDQFSSDCSFESVSTERVCKSAEVDGHWLTVEDCPGITVRDPDTGLRKVISEIRKMRMRRRMTDDDDDDDNVPALVFVVRIGRMSREELTLIRSVTEGFYGRHILDHMMVLFTHGDELGGRSIDQLIWSSTCVSDLVSRCGGRYCVFNNKETGNREQVRRFLNIIDQMCVDNKKRLNDIVRRPHSFSYFLFKFSDRFEFSPHSLLEATRRLNELYKELDDEDRSQ